MEWQGIGTAPKDGTPVMLKSEQFAPDQPFWWSKRKGRWETRLFAVVGSREGWWDRDCEQPTHWRATRKD